MLLDHKTAIVYGTGGAIGSAVARAYAREGAEVHLAGRTRAALEEVAQRICFNATSNDDVQGTPLAVRICAGSMETLPPPATNTW